MKPRIAINQKHTIKAEADPFLLTIEIDLDQVTGASLVFSRAGAQRVEIPLVEADIAALEELTKQSRAAAAMTIATVHQSLGIMREEQ